ncbi:hypothetical protein C0J52_25959 [Blattella germanica]|nr:hypothetical protein C0J52_25959 [Blattella germanica]
MRRELRSYLLETYLPSSLFVIMSWGSFVVIPDMVPGRMVLLVTTLLSLVTMFDTVRNNSPSALELKCIEVRLISCTLFVFFALLEYFIVLFGIRYDKFWRHKKRDLDRINATSLDRPNENSQPTTLAAVAAAAAAAAVASNNVATATPAATNNHHRPAQLPPILHHRVGTNRVDNLRLFGGNSKIVPEEGSQHLQTKEVAPPRATVIGMRSFFNRWHNRAPTNRSQSLNKENIFKDGTSGEGTEPPARKKFRMVAEYVVLYCGSQRGTVDQVSLVLFPICFILFALVYWISYISSASKHDHV